MIGAIKRRWKSKKVKVLHKGSELSSTIDNCPASRGFVDGCEEYDKMNIKPPSPRQIHPVSETETKFPSVQNSPLHHHHSCKTETEVCPFIRVNSGRIELVSNNSKDNNRNSSSIGIQGTPHYHLPHPPGETNSLQPPAVHGQEGLSEKLHCRLGGRLKNDTRHSWCGSASRDGQGKTKCSTSGLVLSSTTGKNEPISSAVGQQRLPQPNNNNSLIQPDEEESEYSNPIEDREIQRLKTSLLSDRLEMIENITRTCQNWQNEEKKEYERCMSDLASQVARAVTLQQFMKSQVEKLYERIAELENSNRAMATVIFPTLVRISESVGVGGKVEGIRKSYTESEIDRTIAHADSSKENKESQMRLEEKVVQKLCSSTSATTSSSLPSPKLSSSKVKKIDCRIPRMSSGRLNRTKQLQNRLEDIENQSRDSSGEPGESSMSCATNTSRLSPLSSSKSLGSKTPVTSPAHKPWSRKSSTYSGIPRISSPRPQRQQEPLSLRTPKKSGLGESESSNGNKKAVVPVPKVSLGNRTYNSNNNGKNDSLKTITTPLPPSNDLHNSNCNNNSRLPIRKTVLCKNSNLGKVNIRPIVHHTNSKMVGSPGNNTIPGSNNNSSNTPNTKPGLGKDEGYSTMSSEALAEQESKDSEKGKSTLTKSNTFNTFSDVEPGSPQRNQLIKTTETKKKERNCSSPSTPPTSAIPHRNNIKIIRGISTSGTYYVDEDDDDEDGETTILWEDSDDSDILFLPLEMSSAAGSGNSSPTLVPCSSSNSRTTGGLPSSYSFSTNSTIGSKNGESKGRLMYPLRRTRPGETDQLQSVVGIATSIALVHGHEGLVDEEEIEEKALIEKWMRLEDVRNQVQWEDEWAWDWDGVESRTTHKWSKRIPKELSPHQIFQVSECHPEPPQSPVKIDSSTWTKSKKNQSKISLPTEKVPSTTTTTTLSPSKEKENQLIITQPNILKKKETEAPNSQIIISEQSSESIGMNIDEINPNGVSPPVIEFRPEFYRLVKYGSNSSVNDNELLITKNIKRNSEIGECHDRRMRKNSSTSGSSSTDSDEQSSTKMDDKIIQTDFNSSLENLSISSELFTECRNCLELIKKLVGELDENGSNVSPHDNLCTLDRDKNSQNDELGADNGAPTTWIPVPKNLPQIEVDRIFDVLSSSESEDILSPNSIKLGS